MPEGVIVDGWNFVIAAYTLSVVVLLGYAWSLARRLTVLRAKEAEDGE